MSKMTDTQYEIERIEDECYCMDDDGLKYKVFWSGYEEPTWEKRKTICRTEIYKSFIKKHSEWTKGESCTYKYEHKSSDEWIDAIIARVNKGKRTVKVQFRYNEQLYFNTNIAFGSTMIRKTVSSNPSHSNDSTAIVTQDESDSNTNNPQSVASDTDIDALLPPKLNVDPDEILYSELNECIASYRSDSYLISELKPYFIHSRLQCKDAFQTAEFMQLTFMSDSDDTMKGRHEFGGLEMTLSADDRWEQGPKFDALIKEVNMTRKRLKSYEDMGCLMEDTNDETNDRQMEEIKQLTDFLIDSLTDVSVMYVPFWDAGCEWFVVGVTPNSNLMEDTNDETNDRQMEEIKQLTDFLIDSLTDVSVMYVPFWDAGCEWFVVGVTPNSNLMGLSFTTFWDF
eukprot:1066401_1